MVDFSALDLEKIRNIEELHHYYDGIIGCMPNNVYWMNRDCVLLGGNDNLAKVFGLNSRSDLAGLTYEEMLNFSGWELEKIESFKNIEIEVMASGVPKFNIEEPPVLVYGKPRYYISSKVPLYDMEKNIIGLVGISTDITEQKLSARELEEAKKKVILEKRKADISSKSRTDLILKISSEIRSPLMSLVAMIDIISRNIVKSEDKKLTEYSRLALESVDLIREQIETIEEYNLAVNESDLYSENINIVEFLESIVEKASEKYLGKLNLILLYETNKTYYVSKFTYIKYLLFSVIDSAANSAIPKLLNIIVNEGCKKGFVDISVACLDKSGNRLVLDIDILYLENFAIAAGGRLLPDLKDKNLFKLSVPYYEGSADNMFFIEMSDYRQVKSKLKRINLLVIDPIEERREVLKKVFNPVDFFNEENIHNRNQPLPNLIIINSEDQEFCEKINRLLRGHENEILILSNNKDALGFFEDGIYIDMPYSPFSLTRNIVKLWDDWEYKLQSVEPKVLIVEDNQLNEKAMKFLLDDIGCKVDTCNDIYSAMNLYANNNYDVMLIDFHLHDEKGIDLIKKINNSERESNTKFIIISSYLSDDDLELCDQVEVDFTLIKPVSREQFKKRLSLLL